MWECRDKNSIIKSITYFLLFLSIYLCICFNAVIHEIVKIIQQHSYTFMFHPSQYIEKSGGRWQCRSSTFIDLALPAITRYGLITLRTKAQRHLLANTLMKRNQTKSKSRKEMLGFKKIIHTRKNSGHNLSKGERKKGKT